MSKAPIAIFAFLLGALSTFAVFRIFPGQMLDPEKPRQAKQGNSGIIPTCLEASSTALEIINTKGMAGPAVHAVELSRVEEISAQAKNRNCSASLKQQPLSNSGPIYQRMFFDVFYLEDTKNYSVRVHSIDAPVTYEPT
jgi:hypothetical protein